MRFCVVSYEKNIGSKTQQRDLVGEKEPDAYVNYNGRFLCYTDKATIGLKGGKYRPIHEFDVILFHQNERDNAIF